MTNQDSELPPETTIAGADYGKNLVSTRKPASKRTCNTLSHELAREAALAQAMGPGYLEQKARILAALRQEKASEAQPAPEPESELVYETCPECDGYGWTRNGLPVASGVKGAVECEECGGSGEVLVKRGETSVCSRCDGDGAEPGNEGRPCVRCGGVGEVYWQTGLPVTGTVKSWKSLPPPWTSKDSVKAANSKDEATRAYGKKQDALDGYFSCPEGRHWGLKGGAGIIPVAIIDGHPMVLLSHRSRFVAAGDTWSSFGGAIDAKDKSPFAAALRETFEEVQGLPTKGQVLHKIEHPCHECGWTYHTYVVLVRGEWAKLADVRVARGHSSWETEGVAWAPDWLVEHYPLHPGFAKSWPEVREVITHYMAKKGSTS